MGDFLNMSEEDIKLKFITPSIMDKGWGYDNISMEKMVKFTDGCRIMRGSAMCRLLEFCLGNPYIASNRFPFLF